jgi:BASS family bile acid:Na+ symporter
VDGAIDAALRLCVVVFTVSGLAGAGLDAAPRAALAALGDRRFVLLATIGAWVLSPALACLLLLLIPLDPPYAMGLLLLALAPCAPFAPARIQAAHGDAATTAAFVLLAAAGTVVVMPLAVPLIPGGGAVDAAAIAVPLALFVLVPLAAGMAVRAFRPGAADRARPAVARVMQVATAGLLLLVAVIHGHSVLEAIGSYAIATETIFIAFLTIAAHLLGAPLPEAKRIVLTIGLCTRNLGAALAPLPALDPDGRAIVMIVIAVPLTLGASAVAARTFRAHAIPLTDPIERSSP